MSSNGSRHGAPAGPNVFVIFGATGDLTQRKLIPALYNLCEAGLLPEEFAIIGVARKPATDTEIRKRLRAAIEQFATGDVDEDKWSWLEHRIYAHTGTFDDPETYKTLRPKLEELDASHKTGGNYLFYLATPPGFFAPIASQLGAAGLATPSEGQWRRLIVEKPFGSDLVSARKLNADLSEIFEEDQIYRIDHYLGKETVQNILMLRFANGIFEPVWNRQFVDHVQITASESVGIGTRAGYYDKSGAMRDMVQNHMMQLLSLTAMEPPVSFDANAVRDEKGKVLRAIRRLEPEDVLRDTVRGQYDAGDSGGDRMLGYRDEPNVTQSSSTETFVALKLYIDNWRWADVPFYLRTGKRLPARSTQIAIVFKRAPLALFGTQGIGSVPANVLVLHLQPDEGISLHFQAKVPGPVPKMDDVRMHFDYGERFGATPSTGYETLVYDCMCGDATLFQRADNVEEGWDVVTPILDVWRALPPRTFPNYPAGSWGPADSDELLAKDGRQWRKPT